VARSQTFAREQQQLGEYLGGVVRGDNITRMGGEKDPYRPCDTLSLVRTGQGS
jgi:hypothetical protein